ncbi:hypothetical protein ACFYT4_25290 [Streptomyces sp. NPDC004609]|uniref:hypothetical protein n=1 Tax=Streptomyces sp. NPDC004609 TaxID=3364704 RepID=UPI00369AB33F
MTRPPVPAGSPPCSTYRAEVTAEGIVGGTGQRARMILGSFASPYPGRVLRWMRDQALRLADGLDPDPATSPIHPRALTPVPYPLTGLFGDAPAHLRAWALKDGLRNQARRQLAAGTPLLIVTTDHTGWYALTAWPVPNPAPCPCRITLPQAITGRGRTQHTSCC